MTNEIRPQNYISYFLELSAKTWQFTFLCLTIYLALWTVQAQEKPTVSNQENQVIIEGANDYESITFGQNVIIRGKAKGALAFNGDIIVEGQIEGDVATVGGSVYQKKGSSIGGDVIVLGGVYRHEDGEPQRVKEKKTIVYTGYEQELRKMMDNPSVLFSPDISWTFVAQRILSVLFWFVIGLALTTIAPGAVSRAVERFRISTLKVSGLGFLGVLMSTVGVIVALSFLPTFLSAIGGLMLFVLLMLAYVFGRTALQAVIGKWLQKMFLPARFQSETIAVLIGSVFLTAILSMPYLWSFALLAIISISLGLVLTVGSEKKKLGL